MCKDLSFEMEINQFEAKRFPLCYAYSLLLFQCCLWSGRFCRLLKYCKNWKKKLLETNEVNVYTTGNIASIKGKKPIFYLQPDLAALPVSTSLLQSY